MPKQPLNFLCVSTYFKGEDFLKSVKAEGNNVYLLTKKKLEHDAWPWESIDDTYYIEEWNQEDVAKSLTKGKIQFQSEACEVYYKNIRIKNISKLPKNIKKQL